MRAKESARRPTEILSKSEIEAMLRKCSRRAPTGVRNAALITVAWRCGLRCGELLRLMPRDVDLELGCIHIRHAKGDKERRVGIDSQTAAVLARWIETRQRLGIGARRPLFCTLKGAEMQDSYIRELLPRLARKAGVDRRVHCHALRHTYAAEMAREGAPVNLIQAALGHSNLSTTHTYLAHVQPTDVIDTMRARTWGGEPKPDPRQVRLEQIEARCAAQLAEVRAELAALSATPGARRATR